jgi:dihydrofolate reductase
MIGRHAIHGYAIVSADDCIAGADGTMPPELHDPEDWRRFQAALDRAAVSVLGRLGHEQNPNRRGRNRLVVSSAATGIERRADATWWDPAKASAGAALAAAAPAGGLAVVVGGRRVFDLFLALGYDAFHLTRMAKVRLPGGVPVLSGVAPGRGADAILAARGLAPGPPQRLDAAGTVTLVAWQGSESGLMR